MKTSHGKYYVKNRHILTKFDIVLLFFILTTLILVVNKHTTAKKVQQYEQLFKVVNIVSASKYDKLNYDLSMLDKKVIDTDIRNVPRLTDMRRKEQDKIYHRVVEYEPLFKKYNVPQHLRKIVVLLSDHYKIDPKISIGLFHIESTWTHNANYVTMYDDRRNFNGTFDIGLGQLNSQYHNYFESNFFNKELLSSFGYNFDQFNVYNDIMNMQVSIAYLDHLLNRLNHDYILALQSYNTGIRNVFNNTIPTGTKMYSVAIVKNYMSIFDVSTAEIKNITNLSI